MVYVVKPNNPSFNIMLYGPPGSGKTTLASTAQDHPAMRNVLFANIEGGLISVAHRGDIWAEDINTTDEMESLSWKIIRKQKPFDRVSTIVLDSGTELQTMNLEEIVRKAAESHKSSKSGRPRTENEIWQEDYGISTMQLKRLFRRLKDAPVNFILTALAKEITPNLGPKATAADKLGADPVAVMPSMTAKLAESAMGYMDFVWYCYNDTEEDTFNILTKSIGPYRCKTRGKKFAAAIGAQVTDPNLASLYDIFLEVSRSNTNTPKKRSARS